MTHVDALTSAGNRHQFLVFTDTADRDRRLVDFLSEGLLKGELCVCFADQADAAQLRADLQRRCPGGMDNLVLLSAAAHYGADFTIDGMLALFASSVADARARSVPGLRVVGAMSATLLAREREDELTAYEAAVSARLDSFPQQVLCLYDAALLSERGRRVVLAAHGGAEAG